MGGVIVWSPRRFVRMPQLKRRVPRVLTEHQMQLLLSAAVDLNERTMIDVLYGTGARAGEGSASSLHEVENPLQSPKRGEDHTRTVARRFWKSGPPNRPSPDTPLSISLSEGRHKEDASHSLSLRLFL
jgi:integrase